MVAPTCTPASPQIVELRRVRPLCVANGNPTSPYALSPLLHARAVLFYAFWGLSPPSPRPGPPARTPNLSSPPLACRGPPPCARPLSHTPRRSLIRPGPPQVRAGSSLIRPGASLIRPGAYLIRPRVISYTPRILSYTPRVLSYTPRPSLIRPGSSRILPKSSLIHLRVLSYTPRVLSYTPRVLSYTPGGSLKRRWASYKSLGRALRTGSPEASVMRAKVPSQGISRGAGLPMQTNPSSPVCRMPCKCRCSINPKFVGIGGVFGQTPTVLASFDSGNCCFSFLKRWRWSSDYNAYGHISDDKSSSGGRWSYCPFRAFFFADHRLFWNMAGLCGVGATRAHGLALV
jgi:hypothetical protein